MFADKIKNRLKNIGGIVELADEDTTRARLDTCLACEYLIHLTNSCKKCGCFMNLKTKMKNVSCPVGKW